ncbi:MAG TPA: CHAT domain-containing protein [Candidatus Atribacteria bacterium]|nr:CHAT domain-containing protein [Candidatus Atribacteria bacterium]
MRGYIKLLSDPPSKKFHGILAAKRLYAEFVYPGIQNLSPEVEHLVIIPDGLLHYLPFEALIYPGENGQDQFLIEKFTISYCPSISSFFYLNQRKLKKKKGFFMAFGEPKYIRKSSPFQTTVPSKKELLLDIYQSKGFKLTPLPYTRTEIKKISKFFTKKNRRIFLQDKARESVLKKEKLEDVLILHFACHGFLDEEVPLRSALVLSLEENSEEDGFFQAREIYTIPINAELIVLSACQTARGMLERGEGVLGLPRSFFYSGARTVVSSLWNVPDKSTAYFMEYFYKFLSQGNSKSESLRLAKIKMLKKFYNPHFWAAFVLNGEPFSLIEFN